MKIFLIVETWSGDVRDVFAFTSEEERDRYFLKLVQDEGYTNVKDYEVELPHKYDKTCYYCVETTLDVK